VAALVDARALVLERRRVDLVDRRLARLELLALLDELLGIVELPPQLVGARVRSLVIQITSSPTERSVGDADCANGSGDPGGPVSHGRDATLPRLPASPTRRRPEAAPADEADSDRGKE